MLRYQMLSATIKRSALTAVLLTAASLPAHAHVGVDSTSPLAAGFGDPLSVLVHITVIVAIGL